MSFAIIKYCIKALGYEAMVWERVRNPLSGGYEFLSPKEARKLIAQYKMQKVYEYEPGCEIYDTPNRDWSKRYKGSYSKLREEKRLAYKMRVLKRMNI